MPRQNDHTNRNHSRKGNLKPANSSNPRWLDTTRFFYAESFGITRNRELRSAKKDWMDLTEDEQAFALAHLQYLDLMAQAGTQRLIVQVRDLLEEIADGLAAEREARQEESIGDYGEDDEDWDEIPEGEEGEEYDDQSEPGEELLAPTPAFPQPVAPDSRTGAAHAAERENAPENDDGADADLDKGARR